MVKVWDEIVPAHALWQFEASQYRFGANSAVLIPLSPTPSIISLLSDVLALWLRWLFFFPFFFLLFLSPGSLTALIKSHSIMKSKRHNVAFNGLTVPRADWHRIFPEE